MENHAKQVDQKLVPDPFLILGNNPKQPLHAGNSFQNKIFWKRVSKSLKKLSSFFWTQFHLMEKLSKTKGAWNWWPVGLQVIKQVQKNSFLRYTLSEQVWSCNVKQFLSYSKNYICKFMHVNSWHHKLFYLSFWIWKVWKGREKNSKIWISRERKELFRWNKKHFL